MVAPAATRIPLVLDLAVSSATTTYPRSGAAGQLPSSGRELFVGQFSALMLSDQYGWLGVLFGCRVGCPGDRRWRWVTLVVGGDAGVDRVAGRKKRLAEGSANSGLDPLTPLAAEPVRSLDRDHPYRHTLGFVDIVDTFGSSRPHAGTP